MGDEWWPVRMILDWEWGKDNHLQAGWDFEHFETFTLAILGSGGVSPWTWFDLSVLGFYVTIWRE